VRLAAHQAVRIGNVFGTTLRGTGFEALPELLPGNAYTVVVPVKSISQAFRTTATITVDPTAVGTDSDPKADPVSATASFWAIPWTLIILIALLIAVLIAAWRWLTARSQVRRMQRGQA
jgi:hypothetical protein